MRGVGVGGKGRFGVQVESPGHTHTQVAVEANSTLPNPGTYIANEHDAHGADPLLQILLGLWYT
jgi:hypothetical protein